MPESFALVKSLPSAPINGNFGSSIRGNVDPDHDLLRRKLSGFSRSIFIGDTWL